MEHLLRSRDRLRLEIKELEGAQSTRGGAVSILEAPAHRHTLY